MFYKDGLGASVYRITGSTEASKNEESEESDAESSEENESNTQEILTVAAPTLPTEENVVQGASEASAEAAVNRPASYTVQPGDTLIEISKKFYGSSQMVMQLKEVNGLDDINKIYIGQELTLP